MVAGMSLHLLNQIVFIDRHDGFLAALANG